MRFFDVAGNELTDGTPILFPVGLGQAIVGTVAEVKSGIGLGEDSKPRLLCAFVVPLQVAPNGQVPGVIAVVDPNKKAVAA